MNLYKLGIIFRVHKGNQRGKGRTRKCGGSLANTVHKNTTNKFL